MSSSLEHAADATPQDAQAPQARWRINREAVAHCIFLALLTFAAHYWYSGRFGIYEDDFATVPYASYWTAGQMLSWIKMHWMQFTHGRPLGWTTWVLVPWIGFKFGGLHAVYVFASMIVMANTVLFYLLIRRAFGASLALVAGLAYCLFPADTTRQMLVHASFLQPSVLLMLVACHFYLSRRYMPAYLFALASFICYEVGFLPFLCMPFLVEETNWRGFFRRLLIHGLICSAMVGVIALIRLEVDDQRLKIATDQGVGLFYRMAISLCVGPYTAMRQFCARAVTPFTVQGRGLNVLNPMIVSFLAILVLLLLSPLSRAQGRDSVRTEFSRLGRPVVAGLAMLVGAYLFAFTPDHFPPTDVAGRMSGIHLAAALGGALIFACVVQAMVIVFRAKGAAWIAAPVLAAYFATLVGFAFVVQKSYVIGHVGQREYFTELVKLCPDLHDGTIVLIEGSAPSNNWYALPNSWSDPLALMQMYDYPPAMENRPLIIPVAAGRSWTKDFKVQGDRFIWTQPIPPYDSRLVGNPVHYVKRPDGLPVAERDLILLKTEIRELQRVSADVEIGGRIVHFKPAPPAPEPYPPGVLYPLLVDESHLPNVMRHRSLTGPFAQTK